MSVLPLPFEILEEIFKLIDKPSLKSVRCANKALAEVAIPHLFDKIVVVPLPLSFRGLTNLARNPTIQTSVKRIVFETHHLQNLEHNDPRNTDVPAYQKSMLDGIRRASDLECLPVIMHDIGPPTYMKSQLQAYDRSVARVSYYALRNRRKIAKLVKAYPQASQFALKGWTYDTTTTTLDEETVPRLAPYFYQRWVKAPVYFRDSVFWSDSKICAEHCISTFCALSTCEGQIKTLDIDGPHWNNFALHYNALHDDDKLAITNFFATSNMQSFTAGIGLYPPRRTRYDRTYASKMGLNGLEKIIPFTTHSLNTLNLRNCSSLSLFKTAVFPCLRQLGLSHLGITQTDLEDFLASHSSTLESITLQSITFQNPQQLPTDVGDPSAGTWMDFIRHLPRRVPNLTEINLSGRLQSHNEDMFASELDELLSLRDKNEGEQRNSVNPSTESTPPDQSLLEMPVSQLTSLSIHNNNNYSKIIRRWNHYPIPQDNNTTTIYDEENCLRTRIHKYILGKGKVEFPEELQQHSGFQQGYYRDGRRFWCEAPSYEVEGDYSWEMLKSILTNYN